MRIIKLTELRRIYSANMRKWVTVKWEGIVSIGTDSIMIVGNIGEPRNASIISEEFASLEKAADLNTQTKHQDTKKQVIPMLQIVKYGAGMEQTA